MDTAGVSVSRPDDPPALFNPGGYRPPERRVTWDEIERIATERPNIAGGAARGALAGVATGGIVMAAMRPDLDVRGEDREWMLIGIAALTLSGALIGGLLGMGSGIPSPIYP